MSLLEIIASVNGDWSALPARIMADTDSDNLLVCHYCKAEGITTEAEATVDAAVTGYKLNNERSFWDDAQDYANREDNPEGQAYYLYSRIHGHVNRGVCEAHRQVCEFCDTYYSPMLPTDVNWINNQRSRWDNATWALNPVLSGQPWTHYGHLCLDCAGGATTCDCCEGLININYDNYGDCDGNTWCQDCLDSSDVYFCNPCDQYHTDPCESSDDYYGDSSSHRRVHDYSYKPDPKFGFVESDSSEYSIKESITWRSRVPFMGFELEVEANDASLSDGVDVVQEHLGDEENYVYLKGDGSLHCGFEIVSHPATLASHKERNLGKALQGLSDLGFRSWRTDTCGIHVHVSRAGFSNPSHVWKFTHFIVDNKQAMVKLAGRNSERWANFNLDGYTSGGVKSRAKGANFYNRYEAINFGNARTLELRFFKGSLRVERLLSALELTEGAVEYTRNLTTKDVMDGGLDFRSFVTWLRERADKYPNLLSYVDTLGLSEYERVHQSVPAQSVSDYF